MSAATLSPVACAFAAAAAGAPFAWRPSRFRTLRVADYAGPPQRGARATAIPLAWPNHPAGSALDYSLRLEDPEAPVSAVFATVDQPGLAVAAAIGAPGFVTVWLEGGVAGVAYTVVVTSTGSGRVWQSAVGLYCVPGGVLPFALPPSISAPVTPPAVGGVSISGLDFSDGGNSFWLGGL